MSLGDYLGDERSLRRLRAPFFFSEDCNFASGVPGLGFIFRVEKDNTTELLAVFSFNYTIGHFQLFVLITLYSSFLS